MTTEDYKMKTLISTFLVLFSVNSFASGIALISGLKGSPGQAFVFTPEGKVKNLNVGDFVNDLDQVMVEVGSQLTFKYYNNNSYYHMKGGSQVKFMNKSLNMVRGTLWVQSDASSGSSLEVITPNAFAKYDNGDFIVNYDASNGKSQVLVLNGDVEFGNILSPDAYLTVVSGKVSQVDKKYQDGLPRNPSMIGMDSFNSVVSSFSGVSPKNNSIQEVIKFQDKKQTNRMIASVSQNNSAKGKIIFIESKEEATRLPASAGPSAMDYYLKTKKEAMKKTVKTKAPIAPVRVYGMKKTSSSKREIASVKPVQVERSIASEKARLLDDIDSAFVMSLEKEASTQKRHSPERLKLIQELESVSQQFQKEY